MGNGLLARSHRRCLHPPAGGRSVGEVCTLFASMADNALRNLGLAVALGLLTSLAANWATKRGWRGEVVVAVAGVFTLLVVTGVLQISAFQSAWVPWAMVALGVVGWLLVLWRMEWRPRRRARAAAGSSSAPIHTAAGPTTAAPQLDWSTPSSFMYVKIKEPLYHPEGRQFLADFRIGTTRPGPATSNLVVRSFVIELRLNGQVVGEYEHNKSDIPLNATETSLGRILIEVEAGDGPGGQLAFGSERAAADHGQWNVKVDAHVICMLEVPGVEHDAKLDYWTETQYAGVRIFGFTAEELRGALRRIGTR